MRICRRMPLLVVSMMMAVACAGFASGCQSNAPAAPRQPKGTSFSAATRGDVFAARLQAMAGADTYVAIVAQATDELRTHTKRDDVVEWAMEQRIAAALASFTNATEPNGYVALLDMMVFATLKRTALEEHWIPTLLHDEGAGLLDAYRRGEQDVWSHGAKSLTQKQLAELRQIIEQWRAANPTQYYVGYVRFTDFANAMHISVGSSQAKSKGSVFGLLFLDPLAGLDPVARELQEYRALSERLTFFLNRLPIVVAWQADLAVYRATSGPQVSRFVENTSKFADATTRFSDAIVKFPQDMSAERTAAIAQLDAATTRQVKSALDQSFAGIEQQRVGLLKDLESHEQRLDATVGKVRGIVERADAAGKSINAETTRTIDAAEASARRTVRMALTAAGALVLGTLLALLLYRLAVKRWASSAASTSAAAAALVAWIVLSG